ncbi:acetyltransferase [Thiomicrorhabdus sp. 6S2-11]|uniref:Acetyltransferase n=1 Tax=Thiomicrorhabdus marina TaxID=2818442 RepID=A0ABS3Q211_9GAMM|nr:acetyltransferase [Thiomicrorhabdus marina]MBO1926311.1 acetyltransferase [Thiomicrorhabdus marina]
MKHLAILGASGHGKVVAEIAELNGWKVSFFDDAHPNLTQIEHWSVEGTTQDLIDSVSVFQGCFIAIGNNAIRITKQVELSALGFHFPVLIHPAAIVSRLAKLEAGTVVMAGAVINPFAKIGQACIINTASTIDHDCVLADGVHVSPGANLAGAVEVGHCSWVGIGSKVKQCIKIGHHVVVGAGAAVVSDISDHQIVVGVPAKPKTSKC